MAARRTAAAKSTTKAKGRATATKARSKAPTAINEKTRTGIMAVLRRLGEEHPSWGDVYANMLPDEKRELAGELVPVFEGG